MEKEYRTWIEVDRRAIENNVSVMRSILTPGVKFCAVVKSNAYGHNIHDFAKEIIRAGADLLAVDSFAEARALREGGIVEPIFVLGYTLPAYFKEAANIDVALTVSSLAQLGTITDVNGLKVFIKLDTGMHRQGFQKEDLESAVARLVKLVENEAIKIIGTYSHLAAAKSRAHAEFAMMQKERFDEMLAVMRAQDINPGIESLAASGGVMMYPEMHYDMVRIGMACYGHFPSSEIEQTKKEELNLIPALSWKSVVSEVKKVSAGERVGYDGTHVLDRDSMLAVVPVGYWHGYDRGLGGKADVIVRDTRAKVIGRVSMDMLVIDVTDVDVKAGDVVTLIGFDIEEEVTAEELAGHVDTTAYEILTRLNPLIKRIYT